jgi:hypothetical protein
MVSFLAVARTGSRTGSSGIGEDAGSPSIPSSQIGAPTIPSPSSGRHRILIGLRWLELNVTDEPESVMIAIELHDELAGQRPVFFDHSLRDL